MGDFKLDFFFNLGGHVVKLGENKAIDNGTLASPSRTNQHCQLPATLQPFNGPTPRGPITPLLYYSTIPTLLCQPQCRQRGLINRRRCIQAVIDLIPLNRVARSRSQNSIDRPIIVPARC
jgi:hypothetical protein